MSTTSDETKEIDNTILVPGGFFLFNSKTEVRPPTTFKSSWTLSEDRIWIRVFLLELWRFRIDLYSTVADSRYSVYAQVME